MGYNPHGFSFVDVGCITREPESSQKSNNDDRVLWIKEMRLHLQLKLFEEFNHETQIGVVITWYTVAKTVCTVMDHINAKLSDRLQYGKCDLF